MAWLFDTSIAILLRDNDPQMVDRIGELPGSGAISVVTLVELEGGVYREPALSARRRLRLDSLLENLVVLPFDDAAAMAYRRIIEASGYSRRKILDRMIAAQAVAAGYTLVTANSADFKDVPGLSMVSWG